MFVTLSGIVMLVSFSQEVKADWILVIPAGIE
jgi:hypothetical protein